ncbi:hypothetical protein GCM10025859_05250 [Alicyclobacillus fastidiosus]|nr:hypothetical protein GCM10025859_05250 [Alicyclobacillus fastidiosus]
MALLFCRAVAYFLLAVCPELDFHLGWLADIQCSVVVFYDRHRMSEDWGFQDGKISGEQEKEASHPHLVAALVPTNSRRLLCGIV